MKKKVSKGAAAKVVGAGVGVGILGYEIASNVAQVFKRSKANAKEAGKLLACSLLLRDRFPTQTISLVGFSLGNQVIKSCLKTLNDLAPQTDLVQNVTFMGAAIDTPDKKKTLQRMAMVFHSVIKGEIKNVHTDKDLILVLFYTPCELDYAMGRNAAFVKQFETVKHRRVRTNLHGEVSKNLHEFAVAQPDDNVFRMKNYDIYSLGGGWWIFGGIGHLTYRENLGKILPFIDFCH